ncbi:MAG: hypothetical protein CMH54_07395 [Myxococcales bacterium]|nr:hypothetical protein [Myxococcales bacterium]
MTLVLQNQRVTIATIVTWALLLLIPVWSCGKNGGATTKQLGDRSTETAETPTKPNPSGNKSDSRTAGDNAPNTKNGTTAPARSYKKSLDPRRVSIDLIDNRYLAHLHRGGAVVPLNDPGVVKFIQGAWKTRFHSTKVDGRQVLKIGRQGVLYVPLRKSLCKDGCRLYVGIDEKHKDQKVTVFMNETQIGTRPVPNGYSVLDIPIGAQHFIDGENRLRLFFAHSRSLPDHRRAAAFLRWLAIVKKADPALLEVEEIWRTGTGRVQKMNLLDLEAWSWHLPIPPNAALDLSWGDGEEIPVTISARTRDGKRKTAPLIDRTKLSARFDLSELVGEDGDVIELSIARSRPIELTTANITTPLVDLEEIGAEPPKYVLIWMVDTLRRDRLKAYVPSTRVQTPAMNELAANGVVFEDAIVQGGHSIPSHTSILTGLYPSVHKHKTPKTRVGRSLPYQPSVFSRNHWRTLLLSSNGYVSKKWGFKRGFKDYKNFIRDGVPSQGDRVWRWLKPWLERHKKRNLYAYINSSDPHVAYRFRKDYTLLYDSDDYKGKVANPATGKLLAKVKAGKIKLKDRDKQRLEAMYDGEVTFNDAYLGELVAFLKEHDMFDDTLIAIISDHGDEFFEHGGVGHGHSLYSELIRIPFIFHHPKGLPSGLRISQGVEAMDIGPTLLALAGLPVPEDMQGADLTHLIRNHKTRPPRPAFASHGNVSVAIHLGREKMILRHGSDYELYDLKEDPSEQTNLKGSLPIVERALKDALSFHLAYGNRWKKARHGLPTNQSEVFAQDAEALWGTSP